MQNKATKSIKPGSKTFENFFMSSNATCITTLKSIIS